MRHAVRILFIIRDIDGAEPLGMMYLASALHRAGHTVDMIGTRGVDLVAHARKFCPQVIGYGCCTGQHRYYLALNRQLKAQLPSFLSLFGGPHPTFFPQMIEEEGVDLICRGEAEEAIVELCERLEYGQCIADTRNFSVKDAAGRITINPPRPLPKDLDRLAFPDRELRWKLDPRHRSYPAQSFITSRGCPFQCAYCFNPAMCDLYGAAWGHRRVRSPANVVDEIAAAKRASGLKMVQFRCSIFPCEEEWLEQFAALYRQRIGLPFYCHVRADQITERVAELLGEAGCHSVNMGIECADEEYRRTVLRRPMTNDTIRTACTRLHRQKIRILADNMLGLPGRSLVDDLATVQLNVECGIDYSLAMLFQPYPGTALAKWAEKHGHFDGDYDAIDFNYYLSSPLTFSSAAEKQQVENLHKLFAVAVEALWLLPLIRRLIRLRPNSIFTSMFRCWYAWCYHRRIMPHGIRWTDMREALAVLFGFYRKETLHVEISAKVRQSRRPVLHDGARPRRGFLPRSVPAQQR